MVDRIDAVRAVMAQPEDVVLTDDLRDVADRMAANHGPDHTDYPGDPEASFGDEDAPWHGADDVPPHPPEDGGDVLRSCASLPLNDFGNGQRFKAHFGQDVIWVPGIGWHVWRETHFAVDRHKIAVRGLSQRLGDLIAREIPFLTLDDWQMTAMAREADLRARLVEAQARVGDDGKRTPEAEADIADLIRQLSVIGDLKKTMSDKRKAHRNFARSTGNTGKIDAALTEVAVHLAVAHEDLDSNPLDVNCQSGLMRFSVEVEPDSRKFASVELLPHDRCHKVTKVIPANFDLDAQCPRFHAFLDRIQPSWEIRAFLRRWFGLSMSGVPVQAMTFFYGAGANGKSVLVELMARLLDGYAADIRIETLTGRNSQSGASATPDLVYLVGARMARASEPREGEPLQDALVKSLTSSEPIMVRPNFGEFFRLHPYFKLTMSGNHKPDIRSTDDGIWRRINLVPFDVQIPEAERDDKLIDKLWEERDGILAWLRGGLCEVLETGLNVPDAVRAATAEYREDSDPIGNFIAGCCDCTGEDSDRIPSRELMLAFNYWLDSRGEGKWTERRVSTRLKNKAGRWKSPRDGRGFASIKSSGVMIYTGIRFDDEFGQRFRNAPRDQDGKPIAGGQHYAI